VHFASTELALGEVNRACVAEAADSAGEPGSGGGGIAVEQVEGGDGEIFGEVAR
jgi:hypothetical protein